MVKDEQVMNLSRLLDRLPYFGYRRQLRRRLEALRSRDELERAHIDAHKTDEVKQLRLQEVIER